MIHYQLRCSEAHEFDGWFKDSAAFERQAVRRLVECPTCGDTQVERALMAPAVSTREAPRPPAETPPSTPAPAAAPMAAAGKMPAHVLAMLQRMRAEVEKHCDYVGPSFAEEARKIHRGESDKRGIYGESTPDEAESLAEEGIEISQIPWVPRADG
ncbi:MAG: DUF1178 family protein [Acetobacteraceae bacterium]|nr:DUF1178 family protein [Acetobacteraceae bacterium]